MDNITIREAELNDLDVLFEFKQELVDAERPFDPTLKPGPLYYYDIRKLIEADNTAVFVAQNGTEIIGCGYGRIEQSKHYLKHRQHVHLGFMYVAPHYRGKGVNSMIIDALKQWAKQRGVTEVRLEVYAENEPALKAYEKVGFSGILLTMRMNLDDDI
jgi:ribosomal protein S18 acetylase RimI-like enzyme